MSDSELTRRLKIGTNSYEEPLLYTRGQLATQPALAWFKREHGHLAVPPDYACPTGRGALVSGLPKIALGMHLGRYADRIRRRGSTSPRDCPR